MSDEDNINNYLPSLLNPRKIRNENISLTQNSILSTCSLSLKKKLPNNGTKQNKVYRHMKENINIKNVVNNENSNINTKDKSDISGGKSGFEDIFIENTNEIIPLNIDACISLNEMVHNMCQDNENESMESKHMQTNLFNTNKTTKEDVAYRIKPPISISFGFSDCNHMNIYSDKSQIKQVSFEVNGNDLNVDCLLSEGSQLSESSTRNTTNINEPLCSPGKRKSVTVNLEIKKMKLSATDNNTESKVLFLNTNAIEKLVYVIDQPLNGKILRDTIIDNIKVVDSKHKSRLEHEIKGKNSKLKQVSLHSYFKCTNNLKTSLSSKLANAKIWENEKQDMSKNSFPPNGIVRPQNKLNNNESESQQLQKVSPKHNVQHLLNEDKHVSSSRSKRGSAGSCSSKKNFDSMQLNRLFEVKSKRASVIAKNIPHCKIIAGTHFAVDAFSYGEIPNVKHYFLTHFHSDHYAGLRKSFNKILYCSKITANLCISRLGVNPKSINIINIDDTIRIDGVEITAVDANHCPGAIMLVFTLPNGKTLLHTGDFRATPNMESYPVFWNKDIHTIYLDTTYCNPRYDFPTQEESIEMAVHLLRLKKMAVEKAGRKFSSVLIVCGTYTIGKEKFYEGVAERVGCGVWACPSKARALQATGARCDASPTLARLHVLPMRELQHETLRSYLDSFNGVFSEIVAFKPSGWENGKSSCVEKDSVTIHGIPYSEHSSFSELVRFVKFLKPKQVVATVDVSGGIEAVQDYFRPIKMLKKDDVQYQSKVTEYFSVQNREPVTTVGTK